MRVLVLGAGGMLGHQLYRTLSAVCETHATLRTYDGRVRELGIFDPSRLHVGVDALDEKAVDGALAKVRPTWVINCVGIIKQLKAADDLESSLAVNALLPHRLARQCNAVDARLIHISTDCVFSGARGNYSETDAADAVDTYGRTKFLGEVVTHGAITVRTSIVGTALTNDVSLFDWFLSRGAGQVKGFTQAVYTGLTSERLSDELRHIIERGDLPSGLWQISAEKITKYELLARLKEAFDLPTDVIPDDEFRCDRSLSAMKYSDATGFIPPSWNAMLDAFVRNRTANYGWKRR